MTINNNNISANGLQQKALLVGLISREQTEEQLKEYLDELAFLAKTAGILTVKTITQHLNTPHPGTFVGKGKLIEINDYIIKNAIDMIIFDDELTSHQIHTIEKICSCNILDRSSLILYIFEKRAKTAQAKLQVELAQLEYTLPRLKRMWTHLERQRGGTGTRGGSGEKEIETDKRVIRKKITILKKKLEQIQKQSSVQRKQRGEFIRVALVGYTNVGKTTIMNLLSKTKLFSENKLFATLDTTVRKVVIDKIPFLLSDTVGFIRKLPHDLVESFKTTLEEAKEADILIHIVDLSHPNFEEHIKIVDKTLLDIDVKAKHTIVVFNKIDIYREQQIKQNDPFFSDADLNDLRKSWMDRIHVNTIFISALKKVNISVFREDIYNKVKELYFERYPYKAEFYS